jgi:hypothetical protein
MPTAAHSAIGGDDALNADLLESFRDTVKIQTFSFPFIPRANEQAHFDDSDECRVSSPENCAYTPPHAM